MAHGDYTGQTKARLAQQHADEVALASKSKTLVTQVVREGQNEEVNLFTDKDYENLHTKQVTHEDGTAEVVEIDSEDPQFQAVKFRASDDVAQVTVGQGREFNLEQGRNYVAPRWVVQHLDQQGVVWH